MVKGGGGHSPRFFGGKMSATSIRKCNCKHEYQSKKYGKDQRVHNQKKDDKGWTCTVCGSEKK